MATLAAGAIIAAGAIGGGIASGYGTAKAQGEANSANAKAAALQTEQSFYNYLRDSGFNLQGYLSSHPEYLTEYNRIKPQYPRLSFESWLYMGLKGNPNDGIWQEIANPSPENSLNTSLPGYVQINGQAAQPQLAADLTNIYSNRNGAPGGATLENTTKWLAANPDAKQTIQGEIDRLKSINDPGGNRTPEEWLVDNVRDEPTGGWAQAFNSSPEALPTPTPITPGTGGIPGEEVTTATPDPGAESAPQQIGQNAATKFVNDVLLGKTAASNLEALQPILDARTQGAALQQDLLNEQRAGATNIRDTQLAGLADLLGTRESSAGTIYNTLFDNAGQLKSAQELAAQGVDESTRKGLMDLLGVRETAANDIYGAQKTGANDIYGAQLLSADTYGQSGREAVDRVLAEQQANRARQGFVGTSSGADLLAGRTIAPLLQQGALARTQAGVDLQRALSAAGIGLQTNLGGAREQNSLGQLQSGVTLAQALGNAGIGYATNTGNAALTRDQLNAAAREQAASGRLGANTQYATTNAGLLDTNAKIAEQNAVLQNALDKLNLTLSGQQTQMGAIGAPASLAGAQSQIQANQNAQQYGDINALLQSLQAFATPQPQQPQVYTPVAQPVVNGWQVAGGAIQAGSQAAGNLLMLNALANSGAGTGTANANSPTGYTTPAGNVGVQTNWGGAFNQTPIYCWIAREVFGWTNPKWLQFREWLLTHATPEFREFYIKNGEAIADRIRGDERAKSVIREHFDSILAAA